MTSRRKHQQQHSNTDISIDSQSFDDEYEGLISSSRQQQQQQQYQFHRSPNRNGSNTTSNSYTNTALGNDIIFTQRSRTPSADSTEIAALNLDHLTCRKVEVVTIHHHTKNGTFSSSKTNAGTATKRKGTTKKKFYKTYYGRTVSISEYCTSHLSMLCYYYPITCGCMVFLVLLSVMIFLMILMIYNPEQEYGLIKHDHSNIQSMYDIQMGDIDHWCLGGGNNDCTCEDPTIPIHRAKYASWVQAFKANRKLVKQYENNPLYGGNNLDVAFVGESIVEEMDGRWMGQREYVSSHNSNPERSNLLRKLDELFKANFHSKMYPNNATTNGGSELLEGVALGIAGDTSPNVLFRLLHGEMPDYFTPKVWWILIGNNDLGRTGCSEEVVVIGILRIVEEILSNRPNARVVINSLLPMTTSRGGTYPVRSDYEDSLIRSGDGYRRQKRRKNRKKVTETLSPITNDDAKLSIAAEEEMKRDNKAQHRHRPNQYPSKEKPIMIDEVNKMHKYKVGAPIIRRNDEPLWTSIRAINREIKKFANKHDRVYYFDATEIFAKKIDNNSHELQTDMISERGHPTFRGFEMWEEAIKGKLKEILSTMKTENPELFKPIQSSPSWNSGGDIAITKDKTNDTNAFPDSNTDDDLDDKVFRANDDYKFTDMYQNYNNENGNILVDPNNNNDDDDTDGSLIVSSTKNKDDDQ